jgi:hypothetical protein
LISIDTYAHSKWQNGAHSDGWPSGFDRSVPNHPHADMLIGGSSSSEARPAAGRRADIRIARHAPLLIGRKRSVEPILRDAAPV